MGFRFFLRTLAISAALLSASALAAPTPAQFAAIEKAAQVTEGSSRPKSVVYV